MADDPLVAEQVRKEFGGLVADDVDFVIPRGDRCAHRAERGHREDDLLQHAHRGACCFTAGSITFDGEDITGMPPHAIVERGIGRTFQNIRLFHQMTALENVLVGMHSRLKGGIFGSILCTPRVRREERDADVRARGAPRLLRPPTSPRDALGLAPVRGPAPPRGRASAR